MFISGIILLPIPKILKLESQRREKNEQIAWQVGKTAENGHPLNTMSINQKSVGQLMLSIHAINILPLGDPTTDLKRKVVTAFTRTDIDIDERMLRWKSTAVSNLKRRRESIAVSNLHRRRESLAVASSKRKRFAAYHNNGLTLDLVTEEEESNPTTVTTHCTKL